MDKISTSKLDAGMRLKQSRELAGLTQSELAKKVKKNMRTIVRWEAGGSSPSEGDWTLMAALLHVSPAWLISGSDPASIGQSFTAPEAVTLDNEPTSDDELRSSPEEVDWEIVVKAYDEAMAYIEMGEELGGDSSTMRAKFPQAVRLAYHFLFTHGGRTPSLREIHTIFRDL